MIYRFEDCELDVAAQELRVGGVPQPVEPQVFALLIHLVEGRDRVLSKDDILEAIWQGRIVSDAALSSRIKAARQAIGDDGQAQRLIRTIHKRGFRFVGAVQVDAPQHAVSTVADAAPDEARPLPVAETGETLLRPPVEPSIAVLPFAAIGEEGRRTVLADGLTHDLITRLGRARWLFVIARGSVFRFADLVHDPTAAAAKLGVRYIVHGSVQADGDRIRVNAALTDAASGAEIWAERFDRGLADLFVIQSDISDAIAGAVELQIEFAERGRSLLKPSENLDAWEAYHRGCWHMYRFRPESYEEAERYFRRSAALDPSSPRPHSGLSFVHWQRAFLEISPDRDGEIARALDFAQEAIALDPRDPQGYHALGRAYLIAGDVARSETELQTAVDLNPSFALGHYSLSRSLNFAGLFEESLEAVDRAHRLSPFDPMRFAMVSVKAMNLVSVGEGEGAKELISAAVRESNAHYHIIAVAAHIHQSVGAKEQAQHYLAQLRAIRPDYGAANYLRAFPLVRREEIEVAHQLFG